MIVGVGIDVVDIARFGETLERSPRLSLRLFTEAEQALPLASRAARFAAKEALAKALGAPVGLVWTDCTVHRVEGGAPVLEYVGTVAERIAALQISSIHLSLSHDAGIASAMVVCERLPAPTAEESP
ncbi:MAG: holo-ACP synthase [Dermatophilaceae bacterium]|nr:holo-ACP synthase [Intrasporangiaceae bacterium]